MTRTIFSLLFALVIHGCAKKKQPVQAALPTEVAKTILGSWQLSDVSENVSPGAPATEDEQDEREREIIQNGAMLSFFDDSTYTVLKGSEEYKAGKWNYINHKKAIRVYTGDSAETIYLKQEVFNKTQVLDLLVLAQKRKESYVRYGAALPDPLSDPFHPFNNRWRLRPDKPETDSQLVSRLDNYLLHLLCILKSSKQREQQTVSFEFSKGIIKIYNGGIGTQQEEDIAPAWLHSFYNDKDAMKAYRLFESYMAIAKYRGKSTGNWVTDDYNILYSIYRDLKAGKFLPEAKTISGRQ